MNVAPSTSQRIKLTLAFDGSGYEGWQWQKIGLGVQQRVEEALRCVFPSVDRVHGSSRTDTGVHANGLVAHVDIPRSELKRMPMRKIVLAVNAHLPRDIRVMVAARAAPEFHAQFDAAGKEYRYQVWNHAAMHPLYLNRAWHVCRRLDPERMKAAAPFLVGRHDFRSFAAQHNYPIEDTVRTLTRCDIRRQGRLFTFVLEGNGFLYKMCRGIVGTLVQVGEGRYEPEIVRHMLEKRDRRVAGMNAPAHGLTLWKVHYRKPVRK